MSVLIYIDQANGHIKKASYEALSYGAAVAKLLGTTAQGVVLGTITDDLTALGKYGVTNVLHANNEELNQFDAQAYTKVLATIAKANNATVIVFSFGLTGKALAPRLSANLQAGLVAGALSLPNTTNGFVVKKGVFSSKAYANITINTAVKIIAISPNSYKTETTEATATIALVTVEVPTPKVKVTATNKVIGEIPLSEAELVISGGRGLKGPENWGLVTDLATEIGAATACSRAVADAHWRPHHEHVGQTGGSIAPNLYFAIGISGAIQHLAGVNRSKTIVVINKDPEAPFFKAADYGIVGDAFEVMPKFVAAVKAMKAGN